MYGPSAFDEMRPSLLHGLIDAHPLGTIITHGDSGLDANHIPFEIDAGDENAPFGILRAHVARANPLWRHAGETLVVFQGPSAYITPALYEDKKINGKVVPTYNYAVVHAHGTLRAIEDPAWILALLGRLTARHEAAQAAPWSIEDAPSDFIDRLVTMIVGIEIPVERMHGKWKVSQNRSQNDQRTIESAMDMPMAQAMQRRSA
ncbi:FMN-binding negative transcriptional regulator [Massilia pseudoviolaceinigra]|uniref:FMN-binding negative transcriptional regulator n=1 Tax=Massilia pseudoviolaceinigra TaxID=3057165 RepID=UPI0027967418|nr:FMN-binding negative transcriptional regulator [Massilia sp. CCM 9206]MDQ1920092.1 FMN-binding negative transcriptional regulator [Massilia sp. CCM 9206]